MNFNRKCLDSLKENPGTKSEVKDARKAYRRILEQLANILKFGKRSRDYYYLKFIRIDFIYSYF